MQPFSRLLLIKLTSKNPAETVGLFGIGVRARLIDEIVDSKVNVVDIVLVVLTV